MTYIDYLNSVLNENIEDKKIDFQKEFIEAGVAFEKGITDKDVDPKELDMGIDVEMEHTTNENLSKIIAISHLAEIPDYYTRLAKMEEEAFAELEKPEQLEERKKKRKKKRKKRKNNLYKGWIGYYSQHGGGAHEIGDGGDGGGE